VVTNIYSIELKSIEIATILSNTILSGYRCLDFRLV